MDFTLALFGLMGAIALFLWGTHMVQTGVQRAGLEVVDSYVSLTESSEYAKGMPEEAVNDEKRARYEKIAAYFLSDFDAVDVPVRFDIISLVIIGPERAMIRHHINAFSS